jgi:hypothetical protein
MSPKLYIAYTTQFFWTKYSQRHKDICNVPPQNGDAVTRSGANILKDLKEDELDGILQPC